MRKLFLIFGIFLMIKFWDIRFYSEGEIQETLSKLGVKQALIDETIALDYEIRDTEYFENDEKIIVKEWQNLKSCFRKMRGII